ncbi:hypothetical protein LZA78_12280 [Sinirhodobacter sp. WL0062]|uniref:RNase NYN domain-containing protein n=1 Tax=Rhodobacter flavimaris TaxID=2907145 RepID=A0ABS8YX71_9RHOB|nr:hypothetical protein [Sinirhodobacter sp. WL0062]MCE5974263.1 hypothetical protein [Sinirhodobacter sp. WL0062]
MVSADSLAVGLLVLILGVVYLLLRSRSRPQPRYAVLDGSNILYWRNEAPDLSAVRQVVQELQARGCSPVIWFDANAGYLVEGRYIGEYQFSVALGVPVRQVYVAPKGTPADPLILDAATKLSAVVVTNDRYRDWAGQYPMVGEYGRFIRGSFRDGRLELVEPVAQMAASAPSFSSPLRVARDGLRSSGP